jgi:hypothetical protein
LCSAKQQILTALNKRGGRNKTMSITGIKTENSSLEYQPDNFGVNVNNINLRPNDLKSGEPLLFSSLPPQIQADIRKAQKEAAEGHVISNEEVFRKIDEWLEKD